MRFYLWLLVSGWLSFPSMVEAVNYPLFKSDTATDFSDGGTPAYFSKFGIPGDDHNMPGRPIFLFSLVSTLSPASAEFNGIETGPLDNLPDEIFGPIGFASNTAGMAGWVSVNYTIQVADTYFLAFEAIDGGDSGINTACALDNLVFTSTLPNQSFSEGFESGIPSTWSSRFDTAGASEVSGAVTGISPTEGSKFLYVSTYTNYPRCTTNADCFPEQTCRTTPLPRLCTPNGFLIGDETFYWGGTRIVSPLFSATVGDTITFDAAMLTQDGDGFEDYCAVALVPYTPTDTKSFGWVH